jgi:hypothetical protein
MELISMLALKMGLMPYPLTAIRLVKTTISCGDHGRSGRAIIPVKKRTTILVSIAIMDLLQHSFS